MKIKEINISDFGSLKNKVLTLDAGLNVIYGENESGKSTVLLFIKYMLYGLGRRSASNSERERSVSWSGHSASGSMTFEHGGEDYRIERRYTDGGRERRYYQITLEGKLQLTEKIEEWKLFSESVNRVLKEDT